MDVQLLTDVAQGMYQSGRGLKAVDARQRRIGGEVLAVGSRAEDPFNREFEQPPVAAFRIANGTLRQLACGDVLHDALEHSAVAYSLGHRSSIADPAQQSVGTPDSKLQRVWFL